MLKRIEIQNYAIIDQLTIDLSDGLNIITGETGAGKSILLGAIGLVMGERADTKVLYHENTKCFVEATFDVRALDLGAYLESQDLDHLPELVIRREIATSGKSRAFVNDTPTTLSVLREINSELVDLHRQFDTLDIHNVSFQIKTLDALADNGALLADYQADYKAYMASRRSLVQLQEEQARSLQEMDFLQFQYKELDDMSLELGEQVAKEEELKRLTATEDIKRVGELLYYTIDESDSSVLSTMEQLLGEADAIKEVDKQLSDQYDRLFAVIEELRDISSHYLDAADRAEYDPTLAAELQERLDMIYKLQNKHRVGSIGELIDLYDSLGDQLKGFRGLESEITQLEQKIDVLSSSMLKVAAKITASRQGVVEQLVRDTEGMLHSLSMPNARLQIKVDASDRFLPTGMDEVAFLFASNKGAAFLPIKDVASGGEISRLTLSIKALIADAVTLPTLIFDEIDTGVSGEVALRMGEIFAQLSHSHQVISITHSPQIAAKADRHFYVYKQDTESRTVTDIRILDTEGRITEIGKMLSGDPPSQAALANAKELINA